MTTRISAVTDAARRTLPKVAVITARQLGDRKAANVAATGADLLVIGHPGYLMQVASSLARAGRPMALAHTVEVLDTSIRGTSPASLGIPAARPAPTER